MSDRGGEERKARVCARARTATQQPCLSLPLTSISLPLSLTLGFSGGEGGVPFSMVFAQKHIFPGIHICVFSCSTARLWIHRWSSWSQTEWEVLRADWAEKKSQRLTGRLHIRRFLSGQPQSVSPGSVHLLLLEMCSQTVPASVSVTIPPWEPPFWRLSPRKIFTSQQENRNSPFFSQLNPRWSHRAHCCFSLFFLKPSSVASMVEFYSPFTTTPMQLEVNRLPPGLFY